MAAEFWSTYSLYFFFARKTPLLRTTRTAIWLNLEEERVPQLMNWVNGNQSSFKHLLMRLELIFFAHALMTLRFFKVLQLLKQAYICTMAEFVYRFLPYQETWKSCVFFIAPNKLEDNFLIDVLSEVVATGLRKLFSIVTFDGLLKDVSFSENFDSSFPLFFRNDQARYWGLLKGYYDSGVSIIFEGSCLEDYLSNRQLSLLKWILSLGLKEFVFKLIP